MHKIILTHKSDIVAGDTIMHNGHMMTVCKKDITRCEFFGTKIFGDSYVSGRKPVEKVEFIKPMQCTS
ncbi:hypothetical protein Asfd1_236 [Aeromonas phage Asfd_1]|nr:hypothetical protein Asfd1_236 [Aeromonas phage Asfd_1]